MGSGGADSATALVNKLGQMALYTLVNGVRTELMVKENSSMLTEMSMMATGQTIKPTEPAFTNM